MRLLEPLDVATRSFRCSAIAVCALVCAVLGAGCVFLLEPTATLVVDQVTPGNGPLAGGTVITLTYTIPGLRDERAESVRIGAGLARELRVLSDRLHPCEIDPQQKNAFCEREDALYVEFIELA